MLEADLLIITGGLGPTADDLTRQAAAEALGQPLVEDAGALRQIEQSFASRTRRMPAINRVQALRPQGAVILPNPHGTAPGLYVPPGAHACDIVCLPGPPREMQPMFEAEVVPRLRCPLDHIVRTRLIHTHGLGESAVASRLNELMERSRTPLVGTTASRTVVTCRIRYEGPASGLHGSTPDELVAATEGEVRQRLEPYIFGTGQCTLASAVLELLRAQQRTLAVVESCTGGLLGAMITEIPRASDVFSGGWITYSNEAKRGHIGVPAELFSTGGPGAVSEECAVAMARGGLDRAGTTDCLSITGIAGPGGGASSKPVGTVWIAHASRNGETVASGVRRLQFPGDRTSIREWSALTALGMLRLSLIGRDDLPLLGEVR
jgi:nicotinamide-nucleotide amidase